MEQAQAAIKNKAFILTAHRPGRPRWRPGLRAGAAGRRSGGVSLNAAAVRKARSRNRNAFSGAVAHQPFDEWSWLRQGLVRRMVKHPQKPTRTVAPTTLQHSQSRRVSRLDSVRYLIVRTLGLTKHRAIESTGIPVSAALELEGVVPDDDTKAELARRVRNSARQRGVDANINVARSGDGLQIVEWVLGLDRDTLEFFRLCVLRESAALMHHALKDVVDRKL